MSKYKKGDKVVIRKDLVVGKWYGRLDWCKGMEYLKELDYVVISTVNAHSYWVENEWYITEEMIEGLYQEKNKVKISSGDKVQVIKDIFGCRELKKSDIVEVDYIEDNFLHYVKGYKFENGEQYYLNVSELELVTEPTNQNEKYAWLSDKFTVNGGEYVYTLSYDSVVNNVKLSQIILNSGYHENIINGKYPEYLLTEEQAKQSPLFTSFKPVEVAKPMYHIKVNPKFIPIENHGYLSKIKMGGYVMDKMYDKVKQDRYLFSEEEATELVNNSNGTLIMEKSKWD